MKTEKLKLTSCLAWIAVAFLMGCTKAPSSPESALSGTTPTASKHIYVASGAVYAGNGITPTTASKTVAKYEIDGTFVSIVKDYSAASADSPAAILDYDSTRLVVLIENTAGRRVEYVTKDVGGVTSIFSNITNLNGIVRAFKLDYSNQFIISKSTAVEKLQFSGSQTPGPAGGTFISNPLSTCGTVATNIVDMAQAPSGSDFVLFSHAAASPNNKVVAIKKTGYGVTSDCLAATPTAPTVNHWPTAILMHSTGVLFVAYSNSTGNVHQVYAFNPTFTASTASFGTLPAQPALNDLSLVQGVSRMMEMPDHSILIASAGPTMNTIEKFTYDATTGLLTRVGSNPFIGPTIFTRSVSGMVIGD